ncbi:MAG: TRAP transporter small permease [Planctomycetota bacterium]|jgi:TRAP-type C4-dicarboxylate transport system permease small subunit|nr:TRAP transporter small permease [Planctomycetota bacterium]
MRKTADRFIHVLEKIAIVLTTFFTIMLMVALVWQVFSRFVIDVPAIWTEEVGRYSFINMVLIGAAIGVKRNAHFGVTFFPDALRGKAKDYYMRFAVNSLVLLCSLFMVYYGAVFTWRFGLTRVSPTFLTPMAYAFVILPISGAFMTCFALYNILFGDYSGQLDSVQEAIKEHEAVAE